MGAAAAGPRGQRELAPPRQPVPQRPVEGIAVHSGAQSADRLLVRAHAVRARLLQDPSLTLREIAAEEGVVSSYVSRLVRLAFLAPDIVTAVLNGRQPPRLTANLLMDDTRLPLDWRAQRELLYS